MPAVFSRRSAAASTRRSLAAGLAALALISGSVFADVAPASAATKSCSAKMSISKPRQYSNTWVKVSKVGSKAKVETVAHYKTTKTKKRATASTQGKASLKYYISGASPNRAVKITVTAKKGKKTWKCSTSFTPRRK